VAMVIWELIDCKDKGCLVGEVQVKWRELGPS
jgi:hypothetical protein